MEAIRQSEIPAPLQLPEADARMEFLALRVWQDAMCGDHPDDEALSQRLGKIVDEFDLLFGS